MRPWPSLLATMRVPPWWSSLAVSEGMDARYEVMQQGSDLPVVLLLRE